MAGLRPGHPRLSCLNAVKTWMPGIRPGMTSFAIKPLFRWLHFESDSQDTLQVRETCRTVDLGHSSDGPSWIDLTEIRVSARNHASRAISTDLGNKIRQCRKLVHR